MCKQILPTSSMRNIWGTVRRTYMLILWLKELKYLVLCKAVKSAVNVLCCKCTFFVAKHAVYQGHFPLRKGQNSNEIMFNCLPVNSQCLS